MKTRLLILILFLFASQAKAQFFSRFKYCDRQDLENIIEKNRQLVTAGASLQFEEENALASQKCIQVISQVLEAEIAAKKVDYVNEESNRLFASALKQATAEKNEQMQIWVSINYAFYLYGYGHYEAALPHFIKVGQLAEIFPAENMVFPVETFTKLGYFTGYIREYEKGIAYLKKALSFSTPLSSETAALKDNIGLFYIKTNKLDQAMQNFEQALVVATKIKDTIRQAKVLGNMADLYRINKNYKKAIGFLHHDIYLSKKSGNNMNTMYALLRLTDIYLETGDIDKARLSAMSARSIAQSKIYFKGSELEATTLLLKIAKKTGNGGEELKLRRQIDSLSAGLKIPESGSRINELNWEMQRQNFNEELNKERARLEKAGFVRNAILVLVFLLSVSAGVYFLKLRKTNKKALEDYHSTLQYLAGEQQRSETKLREANNSLSAYTTYLSEKNQQIQRLESEIANIKTAFNSNEKNDELNNLLESHLMTDENWNKFKNAFAREHTDYYLDLITNYKELTEANLRIVLLQKLGLNNVETANLLGITVDAVKKAKQRLKKKFDGRYEIMVGISQEM